MRDYATEELGGIPTQSGAPIDYAANELGTSQEQPFISRQGIHLPVPPWVDQASRPLRIGAESFGNQYLGGIPNWLTQQVTGQSGIPTPQTTTEGLAQFAGNVGGFVKGVPMQLGKQAATQVAERFGKGFLARRAAGAAEGVTSMLASDIPNTIQHPFSPGTMIKAGIGTIGGGLLGGETGPARSAPFALRKGWGSDQFEGALTGAGEAGAKVNAADEIGALNDIASKGTSGMDLTNRLKERLHAYSLTKNAAGESRPDLASMILRSTREDIGADESSLTPMEAQHLSNALTLGKFGSGKASFQAVPAFEAIAQSLRSKIYNSLPEDAQTVYGRWATGAGMRNAAWTAAKTAPFVAAGAAALKKAKDIFSH